MWFIIATGSALLFGLAGLWMKVSQMKSGSMHWLLLGLYVSGTCGFTVHAVIEHTWHQWLEDPRVWVAGVIIGAGSAWGNLVFMKALEYGPASLTSPLTNMNIVLVIIMGMMVYNESLSGREAVGIVLLLIAVMLISARRKEPLSIGEKRWFAYVAAGIALFAIRNGGLKVTDGLGMSGAPVLSVAYLFSILWFLPPAWRERNARGTSPSAGERRKLRTGWRYGLLAGIFSYGGLQLYAIALQTGKANVAAPIFATNSLVVAIGAITLYRERLTKLQTVALLSMIIGLVVIRL